MLYRVIAPHFVAGVITEYGVINRAAPILKWTKGRTIKWFKTYCAGRGWRIKRLGA